MPYLNKKRLNVRLVTASLIMHKYKKQRSFHMRKKITTEEYEEITPYDNLGREHYGTDEGYGLHSWNYTPNQFTLVGRNKYKERFGVEIEIDKGSYGRECCEEIRNLCSDNIYLKHDGSLINGIEIVSMPATLASHRNPKIIPWKRILETAKNCGFRSHNAKTCGLHVHVDRKFFGDSQREQTINIAKLILLMDKFWDKLVIFSRREEYELNRWASRINWYTADTKTMINEHYNDPRYIEKYLLEQMSYSFDKQEDHDERYKCLNIQNSNTVEFRLFRGTLKYSTFMACIELVSELIHSARNSPVNKITDIDWLDVVGNTQFPELKEYLIEKNLFF